MPNIKIEFDDDRSAKASSWEEAIRVVRTRFPNAFFVATGRDVRYQNCAPTGIEELDEGENAPSWQYDFMDSEGSSGTMIDTGDHFAQIAAEEELRKIEEGPDQDELEKESRDEEFFEHE